MGANFVHLNLHTEFSIGNSIVRIKALMDAVSEADMPAVAMADRNNLFGMVKFYKAAIRHGVKPIIGAELLVRDATGSSPLLCFCKDETGYRNLSRLLTRAYLEGQEHGQPMIRKRWLKSGHADGLLALSGGAGGVIGAAILAGEAAVARSQLDEYREIFGGDFYIEVQRTGRPREEEYLQQAVQLASDTGCPVVATNDVRFLRPGDYEAYEARVCIHQGRMLSDRERPRDYSQTQYLRSPAEMAELFADLPEAVQNTVAIARRCTLNLQLDEVHLPEYEVPDGTTVDEYLDQLAADGLKQRFGTEPPDEYRQRLQRELDVINGMKFPGYFLIVADFIDWAKRNDVPVGPGRGSGAGSLVAYALGITDLDPIEHDLLFERFLNPERVSMPDFDIDFCMEGRDRVIAYVAERYGRDRVSQIITYGTMAAKAVVRDVGRILGHPFGFVDRVAKLIPFEVGITLEKALAGEQELRDLYEGDEEVRAIIDLALQLEGLVRNAGKHAGGVVIAPSAITDFTPLAQVEGEQSTVTQFDKLDVEAAGLVKFDFLGLRTLTIIDRAVKTINAERAQGGDAPVDIRRIPMDDEATFALLQSAQTTAIFQLESRGMQDLIQRLKPEHFDDVVALLALFRPGPLQSGMVDSFVERKHDQSGQAIDYLHPELEPVLRSTYGVILYQEQVMKIAQKLSGYSLGQADLLRRAMGKKKPEEMAKQRTGFVTGADERGIDPRQASHIFDLIEKFAGYGFNKSHSAAYALLSYQTAWLKTHFAAAFMASVLSSEMDDTDKLQGLKRAVEAIGLKLLPPDINDSGFMFEKRSDDSVRYGLGAIKGLGRGAAEQIIEARRDASFENLHDFCERIDTHRVGRRAVEALIKSGALDCFGINRPSLLAAVETALTRAEQAARAREAGQNDMFGDGDGGTIEVPELVQKRDWGFRAMLDAEYESLGLYLSGHPFDQYSSDEAFVASGSIRTLVGRKPPKNGEQQWGGQVTQVAGLVTGLRRRGGRVTLDLDDGGSRLEVALSQELYDRYRPLLSTNNVVVIKGKLRFEEFLNDWRLRATDVQEIDRLVEARATGLVIRWHTGLNGALDASRLKSILEPYRPGRCSIKLMYVRNDGRANIKLGKEWTVRPSRELRERLSGVVGVGGFRFTYNSAG